MEPSNKSFSFNSQWAYATCGVTILGEFRISPDGVDYKTHRDQRLAKLRAEGTGFVMASYIDSEPCRVAEEWFGKMFKEHFRSEKRLNKNSGREFYFVIYDVREAPNGN